MTIQKILYIRYRQLEGILQEVPWLYRIALGLLVIAGAVAVSRWVSSWEQATMVAVGTLISITGIHQSRSDRKWLLMYEPNPWKIYWGEYTVVSAPLWLPLLFSPYFYIVSCLLIALMGIAKLPYREQSRNQVLKVSLPLPKTLFEWRSGLRKTNYLPAFLYIASYLANYWPYAPLALLWIIQSIMVTFYEWHEPREILENNSSSAKGFLHAKIGLHLKSWSLAIVPICLLQLAIHPQTVWVVCGFGLFSCVLQVFFIVAKYALYEPNTRLEGNRIMIGMAVYSIVIPFLLPVTLIMGIRYYRMALSNLQFYWDA